MSIEKYSIWPVPFRTDAQDVVRDTTSDISVWLRWRLNTCMRSREFESQTAAAPITPEKARMAALKKQKNVAAMALSTERKRQTIARAQKQIAKDSAAK